MLKIADESGVTGFVASLSSMINSVLNDEMYKRLCKGKSGSEISQNKFDLFIKWFSLRYKVWIPARFTNKNCPF